MTTSRADVATASPERYAKQLMSHLGRKLETTEDGLITFPDGLGSCRLIPHGDHLVLTAEARDEEALDRVEQVVGSHLERFGQRNELVVVWKRP